MPSLSEVGSENVSPFGDEVDDECAFLHPRCIGTRKLLSRM